MMHPLTVFLLVLLMVVCALAYVAIWYIMLYMTIEVLAHWAGQTQKAQSKS